MTLEEYDDDEIEDSEPRCPACGQEMLPHEGHCPDDLCIGVCDDCCLHTVKR